MTLIKYNQLVMNEGGINLQKGMNFGIKGSYSIVLMSTLKNAPYSDEMLNDGVILRNLESFGLPECIRITIGTEEENDYFLKILNQMEL